jgi:hypothetical protein
MSESFSEINALILWKPLVSFTLGLKRIYFSSSTSFSLALLISSIFLISLSVSF